MGPLKVIITAVRQYQRRKHAGGLDQALGKLFTTRSPIGLEPLRICSSIIMGHAICLFRKFVTFYHYKKITRSNIGVNQIQMS